jgi:hypothetical protein
MNIFHILKKFLLYYLFRYLDIKEGVFNFKLT